MIPYTLVYQISFSRSCAVFILCSFEQGCENGSCVYSSLSNAVQTSVSFTEGRRRCEVATKWVAYDSYTFSGQSKE